MRCAAPVRLDDVVGKFYQLAAGRDGDLASEIKQAVRLVDGFQVRDLMALLARTCYSGVDHPAAC